MGKYKINLKSSAAKEIDAIGGKKDRHRILSRIQSLADNPRPFGYGKLLGHPNNYRVREGNYRVLYTVDDLMLSVDVWKIGNRKDVYR